MAEGVRERIRSLEGAMPRPGNLRVWEFAAHGRCSDPQQVVIDQRSMHTWRFTRKAQDPRPEVQEILAELKRVFGEPGEPEAMDKRKAMLPGWQLRLSVACRHCAACRNKRANEWAARARGEIEFASRTWFTTLTFGPAMRATLVSRCRIAAAEDGEDFDALSADEQFSMLVRAGNTEVTKWLKRVRKRTASQVLRYVVVAEPHKDGFVHFHALLHEQELGAISYRDVTDPWNNGFIHSKLVVDELRQGEATAQDCAWYVCKYLNKDARSRVRASVRYGAPLARLLKEHGLGHSSEAACSNDLLSSELVSVRTEEEESEIP